MFCLTNNKCPIKHIHLKDLGSEFCYTYSFTLQKTDPFKPICEAKNHKNIKKVLQRPNIFHKPNMQPISGFTFTLPFLNTFFILQILQVLLKGLIT